jgi:protein-tyrosine-phosphatase
MKIHFVSYGHAFRSRIAEAYLKYLLRKHKAISISSSGIVLENDLNGPIAWYAMKLLAQNALVPYMSLELTKTTKELLDAADKIIFIDRHSYEFCKKKYGFHGKDYEVWDLSYIVPDRTERGEDLSYDIQIIERSEVIYDQIKSYCRKLYNDFSVTDLPFAK